MLYWVYVDWDYLRDAVAIFQTFNKPTGRSTLDRRTEKAQAHKQTRAQHESAWVVCVRRAPLAHTPALKTHPKPLMCARLAVCLSRSRTPSPRSDILLLYAITAVRTTAGLPAIPNKWSWVSQQHWKRDEKQVWEMDAPGARAVPWWPRSRRGEVVPGGDVCADAN